MTIRQAHQSLHGHTAQTFLSPRPLPALPSLPSLPLRASSLGFALRQGNLLYSRSVISPSSSHKPERRPYSRSHDFINCCRPVGGAGAAEGQGGAAQHGGMGRPHQRHAQRQARAAGWCAPCCPAPCGIVRGLGSLACEGRWVPTSGWELHERKQQPTWTLPCLHASACILLVLLLVLEIPVTKRLCHALTQVHTHLTHPGCRCIREASTQIALQQISRPPWPGGTSSGGSWRPKRRSVPCATSTLSACFGSSKHDLSIGSKHYTVHGAKRWAGELPVSTATSECYCRRRLSCQACPLPPSQCLASSLASTCWSAPIAMQRVRTSSECTACGLENHTFFNILSRAWCQLQAGAPCNNPSWVVADHGHIWMS